MMRGMVAEMVDVTRAVQMEDGCDSSGPVG